MRMSTIRLQPLLAVLLAVTGLLSQPTSAENNPVGSWRGIVTQQQRNIVVRLTVTNLQIGDPSGDMRWGSPRACSMHTEYSGMRDAQYTFNIAGSNGGWCDLYRDGTLFLEIDRVKQRSLTFRLADKQGARSEQGELGASPSKP
jgi:hypothetical protein